MYVWMNVLMCELKCFLYMRNDDVLIDVYAVIAIDTFAQKGYFIFTDERVLSLFFVSTWPMNISIWRLYNTISCIFFDLIWFV